MFPAVPQPILVPWNYWWVVDDGHHDEGDDDGDDGDVDGDVDGDDRDVDGIDDGMNIINITSSVALTLLGSCNHW